MAEKTEKATPKKLRDARKKGQVAKSQDFPSAFTFVVAIVGVLASSSYYYKTLTGYIIQTFRSIGGEIDVANKGGSYIMEAIDIILMLSLPLMIVVAFAGVIVNFLIIGPVFSMEAIKFNLKKLNPIEGIKQKFKLKVLIELIKSILKILGAAIIIYLITWKKLSEIIFAANIPVLGSALILSDFLKQASIQVGIFFLLVALFDLAFQRRTFAKEMMMEKFEVKQEYKDTEGDPHIKGKRRETFREIAYSEGPSAARKARVIVTNPTHIAVAIGYEKDKDPVPTILTMGQGTLAEKIISIAVEVQVPIMRNVSLARELFLKGRISDYIPEDTYQAIAEILKWISTLEEQGEEIRMELFQ